MRRAYVSLFTRCVVTPHYVYILVNIGSDNGLSLVQRQAINCTIDDSLRNFFETWIQMETFPSIKYTWIYNLQHSWTQYVQVDSNIRNI